MKRKNNLWCITILFIIFLSACSSIFNSESNSQEIDTIQLKFKVMLPNPLEGEEKVYLEILDEITGIDLNPRRFELNPEDEMNYSFNLPSTRDAIIYYRYIKIGEKPQIERNSYGEMVDYRVIVARGSNLVDDKITGWEESLNVHSTSELSGYIYDAITETPISEALVFINGMRTLTSFDGYYQFKNMPSGEFDLVAIHPQGKYEVFQQKAIIADNSLTPANFGMTPSKFVDVTFEVISPEETPENASIRLLGNLFSLGNTYTQQPGGSGIMASRSPQLISKGDNKFAITLNLPSGFDLQYKYSLGDYFINAEHKENGDFLTRQLVVPNKDVTIHDVISTWYSKEKSAVHFIIETPINTPPNTTLSIQLNPFVWMDPFPIWPNNEKTWTYSLFSPMEYLNNAQFRFCRNDQCGLADDQMTLGQDAVGFLLTNGETVPPTINYSIENWAWLQDFNYQVQQTDFASSQSILIKGFALKEEYDMSWLPYIQSGLIDAGVAGANWIILPTGWIFQNQPSQKISHDWSKYPSSDDITNIYKKTTEAGMNFVLFPQPGSKNGKFDIWQDAELTFGWWDNWFNYYERMVFNYADFAEKMGISTLIIAGNGVTPAFPNGSLPDGNPSNSPYDAEGRWLSIIENVRSRFNGQIGFALPYSHLNDEKIREIIRQCDFVFLHLDTSITETSSPRLEKLEEEFGKKLDDEIYKLYESIQRPIIMNIDYYALSGSASNCQDSGQDCRSIYQESLKIGNINPDVIEQADIYQAILRNLVKSNWITGIVSNGYDPVNISQDASNSVRGKPAYHVLSYYFNNITR